MTLNLTDALKPIDAGTARLEAIERMAGVPVGTWRTEDAKPWQAAIRLGLRRRVALEERAERMNRS